MSQCQQDLRPRSLTVRAIDIVRADSLLSRSQKGGSNASVLYEVPRQERDQEPQEHRHEEQATGNPGHLPDLWHQGIQNRQAGLLLDRLTELRRDGCSQHRDVQPSHFAQSHITSKYAAIWALVRLRVDFRTSPKKPGTICVDYIEQDLSQVLD